MQPRAWESLISRSYGLYWLELVTVALRRLTTWTDLINKDGVFR